MSYDPERARLERLHGYRILALAVALGLLLLSILSGWVVFDWLRALAWCAAGVISILEGRLAARLGHNPSYLYFYAVACFIFAIICVV